MESSPELVSEMRHRCGTQEIEVGDTRHPLTHVLLVSTLAPRGFERQPAGRGMSKHAQSITSIHRAHSDSGMLRVKDGEEALGVSDNTAPSRGPEAYLLAMTPSPGSTCVLNEQSFPPS